MKKDRMCTWQQRYLVFSRTRKPSVFISDVGIRCFYLSLTRGTAKFKQLDESCSF